MARDRPIHLPGRARPGRLHHPSAAPGAGALLQLEHEDRRTVPAVTARRPLGTVLPSPLMLRVPTVPLMLVAGALTTPALAHGGGLNACGCHFDRKTGECHCHRETGCGCPCQPPGCAQLGGVGLGGREPAPLVQDLEAAPELEPLSAGAACGRERWAVKTLAVKTLSDPAARGLHRQTPQPATV